jgi:hypothetical protein
MDCQCCSATGFAFGPRAAQGHAWNRSAVRGPATHHPRFRFRNQSDQTAGNGISDRRWSTKVNGFGVGAVRCQDRWQPDPHSAPFPVWSPCRADGRGRPRSDRDRIRLARRSACGRRLRRRLDSLHWTYAGTTLRTATEAEPAALRPGMVGQVPGRTVRNPRYGLIHDHRTRPTPPLSTPSTAIPRPCGSRRAPATGPKRCSAPETPEPRRKLR